MKRFTEVIIFSIKITKYCSKQLYISAKMYDGGVIC